MRDDRLTSIGARALDLQRALPDADRQAPLLLTFLLRRYAATGEQELLQTLEPALACAVLAASTAPLEEQPRWIALLVEACAMSADDRLREALASLTGRVIEQDFSSGRTCHLFRSVTAAIAGAASHHDPEHGRELLRRAIHALEDVVGAAYQPGSGVAREVPRDSGRDRDLPDQIEAASALVAAYLESARLPYSMLAEEFVQFAKRQWWSSERGRFDSCGGGLGIDPMSDEDFAANAEAARLFCRLALLHRDEQYRSAAVLAPDADYLADAERVVDALAADALTRNASLLGLYGLAVDDQLRLQTDLQ